MDKGWINYTPFSVGREYVPRELFSKYSQSDLLKWGLRKVLNGKAVELNADSRGARVVISIDHEIVFQGPNWYVPGGLVYEDQNKWFRNQW